MCYALTLVSPLTLTEVRSMLPDGVAADLVPPSLRPIFLDQLLDGKTAAALTVGRCACGLVGGSDHHPDEDEKRLRDGYRKLRWTRKAVIETLERHRAGAQARGQRDDWGHAFRSFIVEHHRNAGTTLYLLQLGAVVIPRVRPQNHPIHEVWSPFSTWLPPGEPVLVT